MKKFFILLLLAAIPGLAAGKNLLTNADFSKVDSRGKPTDWIGHSGTQLTVNNNSLTFGFSDPRPGKPAILTHSLPGLRPGVSYRLQAHLQAPRRIGVHFYIEGKCLVNGKSKGFFHNVTGIAADEKGIDVKTVFSLPGDVQTLYLTLRTSGKTPVTISGCSLTEIPVIDQNSGFWDVDGNNEKVVIPSRGSVILRQVPVKSGKTYRMNYTICGSGSNGDKNYFCHQYKVSTRLDVAGGVAFQDVLNAPMPKTQIFSIPANASYSFLDFTFTSSTGGTLTVSDLQISEHVKAPEEDWQFFFTSPCYRNTIYQRTDDGKVSGKIIAAAPAAAAKISIKGIAGLEIPLNNGCGEFSIPSTGIKDGKYPVSCIIYDRNGKELKKFETTLFKVPPAENEVIFNSRKILLVNGKPFFPVSEYRNYHTQKDSDFYHLARRGINTFMLVKMTDDEKKTLSILDSMHKYGIKAVIELWPAGATPAAQETFKRRFHSVITPAVSKHPALLAYLTTDEPLWMGVRPQSVIWTKEYIQAFDPYHPVWVNQAPRNEIEDLKKYADASDIVGADIYPVPVPNGHCGLEDKSLNCVGAYTRRMAESVSKLKPVWMILQAFEWQDHNQPQNRGRTIYPTENETRFMYFDAIFNGATGLSMYGTPKIKDLRYYEMIYRIAGELRTLSGLITGSDPLPDLSGDNPAVRIARRICDGRIYCAIMNKKPEKSKVSFAADAPLTIYRESRRLYPVNGKITITLEPYEVIICGPDTLPPPVWELPEIDKDMEKIPDPLYQYVLYNNGLAANPVNNTFYQGKANWIWHKDLSSVPGNTCVMSRSFQLSAIPGKAELLIACDDSADVWINGQKAGECNGHSAIKIINVLPTLKKGENLLRIVARDAGVLPCGLLAELRIDGKPFLITDDSWQCMPVDQKNSPVSAFIVAPFGEGPWGSRVLMP
ncbi:MAG: hypothetical protein J6S43_04970 [Lentisphaeria bacterium]|nr:hypothetical protein [Lentisphaeria bacterium]